MSAPEDLYYLVYDDVEPPQTPTRARRIRSLSDGERDDYWLVEIAPPIRVPTTALQPDVVPPPLPGGAPTTEGEWTLFGQAVLRARHRGYSLAMNQEWPAYVHVAVPLVPTFADPERFRICDTFLVYWGMLYTDEDKARTAGLPWYVVRSTDCYLVLDESAESPVVRSCFRDGDRPWHAIGEYARFVPFSVHPPIPDQVMAGTSLDWVILARDDTRQPLLPIGTGPVRVRVFHDIDVEGFEHQLPGSHFTSTYQMIGAGTLYVDRDAALASIK